MIPPSRAPGAATDPTGDGDVAGKPWWLRAALAVGRRWPTWLALTCAAISLADVGDGLEYMILFVLPATGYLFLAVVDRPRITWVVAVAAMATVVVLRTLDIDPWPALAVVVVALAAVGLLNDRLRRPRLYALQSPGALAFMAFGLVVLSVPATVAGYLVAIGLLGHAAWDAMHWRANKIVARSFAEWCGVLDLVLGVGLLALLLVR
ncbi:hypothetical protein [Nonomuraea sp. B19D2]|uniref:hypothetical protein n=1 Tax=Nonomuraea sp. B19D2 TaxID=3159561 RepID=UPI0032DA8EF0